MRFILVHGGFHGAWCWNRVVPELNRLGHEALAIDLPGHGELRNESSTLANRRDAILAVMRSGDVLVGHSAGGFDVTLAADAASERVGHLVYLASAIPLEGRTLIEATRGATLSEEGDIREVGRTHEAETNPPYITNAQGRLEWIDRMATRELFYHDCDAETADWAFAQLSAAPLDILVEPVSVPRFWSAELPRSYIVCVQDRVLPFALAMRAAGRLGVAPLYIEGSHSPFFSRPNELAKLLIHATSTKPVAALRPN